MQQGVIFIDAKDDKIKDKSGEKLTNKHTSSIIRLTKKHKQIRMRINVTNILNLVHKNFLEENNWKKT